VVTRRQSLKAHPGGFSFIELVVIIALIAAVSAISAPMLISFVQAQRTQGAARELVAMLHQARQLAITRNTPFSVDYQATPQGDQVRFCSGTATPCPVANVWAGPGTGANGWMGLANGDRITLTPTITFSALGAATAAGTLRVQNPSAMSCLDVVVSPAGRVRIAAAGSCP